MPRSRWTLIVEASCQVKAKKIVGECILALNRPPIESKIEAYHKGGFMASLEFFHDDRLSWPELVYEVLSFSQALGVGWSIFGQLDDVPSGVLSKEGASGKGRTSIPGLVWAEWQVFKRECVT